MNRELRKQIEAKFSPRRPEYYVQTGSMFENPYGVPYDEIARFIVENSPEIVAQVVFGKYVENSGLVFSGELIQSMIDRSLPRIIGNTYHNGAAREEAARWIDTSGEWGYRYFTGIDVARQTDYTVISVIDTFTLPARLVYWKRLNRVPWETIYGEIGKARAWFGPNILVDGTGPGGDVVMDALESRMFCTEHERTFLAGDGCRKCRRDAQAGNSEAAAMHAAEERWLSLAVAEAFYFTSTTKKELVEHLRNVLSVGYDPTTPDVGFGHLRTPPIVQLEEELAFYAWDDKKLETDSLFSLALAAWAGLEDPVRPAAFGSPYGR